MNQDELKTAVGQAAANYIKPMLTDTSIIGVGTGSTANCFIDALSSIGRSFEGAVASSRASAARLEALGIKVFELNQVDRVLVYIDGADESNDELQLIKGGGGALTREKIVAGAADRFICIVDESKIVPVLGAFPLPIEVIPMATRLVQRRLAELGCEPRLRDEFVTDNGNQILDLHHLDIIDAVQMEQTINNIPGVVSCGLFAQRPADLLLSGTDKGIDEIRAS